MTTLTRRINYSSLSNSSKHPRNCIEHEDSVLPGMFLRETDRHGAVGHGRLRRPRQWSPGGSYRSWRSWVICMDIPTSFPSLSWNELVIFLISKNLYLSTARVPLFWIKAPRQTLIILCLSLILLILIQRTLTAMTESSTITAPAAGRVWYVCDVTTVEWLLALYVLRIVFFASSREEEDEEDGCS